MIYYCDSSAVVKIYIDETGSSYMKKLSRGISVGDVFINDIAGPEVVSALHRRLRSGDLSSEISSRAYTDFVEDFQDFFNRIPVSDPIIRLAMQLIQKHPLRAYDSVQLATAVHLQNVLRTLNGREVRFIGSDKILNDAAQKEGLTIINPNDTE